MQIVERERHPVRGGAFQKNKDLLPWHPAASFEVFGPALDKAPSAIVRLGPVSAKTTWDVSSGSAFE